MKSFKTEYNVTPLTKKEQETIDTKCNSCKDKRCKMLGYIKLDGCI